MIFMRVMKGKIGWVVGTIETIVGFVFFIIAQIEISGNSRYTWTKPYTSYETQVLMVKWIGVLLLIYGIINLGLKVYQERYTEKHTQEMSSVVKRGGKSKCLNCGLALTADVECCPRCGKKIEDISGKSVRCGKCGNLITEKETSCPKCGQRIIY